MYDPTGNLVGRLRDIVYDQDSREFDYAVIQLSSDGFALGKPALVGTGRGYLIVPWDLLVWKGSSLDPVLSSASQRWENAPRSPSWPQPLTPGWDASARAYWEAASP